MLGFDLHSTSFRLRPTRGNRAVYWCMACVLVMLTLAPHSVAWAQQDGSAASGSASPVAPVPSTTTLPEPRAGGEALATGDSRPVRTVAGLHELSPMSMFLAADVVVKAVIVGLMLASLATWTIFLGKTVELALACRRLTRAIERAGGLRFVADAQRAGPPDGFLAELLDAARHELDLSGPHSSWEGVKERGASRFADLVRLETQTMRRGMGLLATIGSTAPFVGLFGTVWGIMNSFIGISKLQTTNLAVVAPGIAEALLATAVGLVAAIPAVIIYNHFSRATRSYGLLINRAAGVVSRLLSRELDRGPTALTRAAE